MEQELIVESAENPFVAKFEAFFKAQSMKDIERLVAQYPDKKSLVVDFRDIEHYDYELADELLVNPDYLLEAAKEALKGVDVPTLDVEDFSPNVRIFNLPEERRPSLRDISSEHLGKFIEVEGVIRLMTEVKPKLSTATWECKRCGNTYKIIQKSQQPEKPVVCECKHRDFNLAVKESKFMDWQKLQIQEPLEALKGKEQPTNVDIYITDDLVNKAAPGDRTLISGVLRLRPSKDKSNIFERYLEAVHIEETARDFEDLDIEPEEVEEIKEYAKRDNVYVVLKDSLAPTIYGHDMVKEAIVLQLFSGVKKEMPDGSRVRGNIHVLLVGEPGMAKSMLLLATDRIAPKSIYVAGKSATGAGLSASAVKDEYGEGGWTIKAGALVLASGGMAMIDEFEKMDSEDRSALHEALEQQRVSVAKAGIVSTFKTETGVLAAANPKFGRLDPYEKNLIDQVNLPPSLLSRFDLFFIIKDVLDRAKDKEIAEHILKGHRVGEMMRQKEKHQKSAKEIEEYEKQVTPEINAELFRKYIAYARQKVFPVMGDDAMKKIAEYYVELRDMGRKEGQYAATHRQLEALIRLSEASARIRLNNEVLIEDVDRAVGIFRSSLEEFGMDKETGKLDIDTIMIGQSHSQVTHLRKVLSIVREKAREFDKVPKQDVIDEAKAEGIDSEKAEELIDKLVKSGDLYRPGHNFLRPVDKR